MGKRTVRTPKPAKKTSQKHWNINYLHDELNGTNEVSQELEDQVLLLFLHLIHTVLLATCCDFGLCKTNASVGLQLIFWDNASCARIYFVLAFLFLLMPILRLELINQGIHVLIFLFIIVTRLPSSLLRVIVTCLLVESTRLDIGVQVIGVVGRGITGVRTGRTVGICHSCGRWREALLQAPRNKYRRSNPGWIELINETIGLEAAIE